jgi:hypothetical protein
VALQRRSPAVALKNVDETAAWDQRPAFTDAQLSAYFGALKAEDVPAMLWVPRLDSLRRAAYRGSGATPAGVIPQISGA